MNKYYVIAFLLIVAGLTCVVLTDLSFWLKLLGGYVPLYAGAILLIYVDIKNNNNEK